MQHSEQIDKLAEALAKAQGSFGALEKNRTVDTGKYKFDYATLDAVLAVVRKPLADNGLSFAQAVTSTGNGTAVDTMLLHTSGQWIKTVTPIRVQGDGNQAFGSALTYGRRYALTALFGICADEDDDGNSGDGVKSATVTTRNPPGISEMKRELTSMRAEIDAGGDAIMTYLNLPATKKLAVKCAKTYQTEWFGLDGAPNSGMRHYLTLAATKADCLPDVESWMVKVEKAAAEA